MIYSNTFSHVPPLSCLGFFSAGPCGALLFGNAFTHPLNSQTYLTNIRNSLEYLFEGEVHCCSIL